MRFLIRFHRALFCFALAGCASIGPDTVKRDRVDYADAMASSWKDQLLLNIVRLRYADTPQFMDVSSIVAGYGIQGTLTANASTIVGVPPGNTDPRATYSTGATGIYGDKPTISYTPLTGNKFAQSLIQPIKPEAIFSLIAGGYPADLVLPLTVQALNGVYGPAVLDGVRQPADPQFDLLVDAMSRIQKSRAFSVRIEKRGKEQVAIGVWDERRKSEIRRYIGLVKRILRLSPKKGEVILSYGAVQRQKDELAVLSRSMLQILGSLSSDVEVPEEDALAGRTYARANLDPSQYAAARIKIHSGSIPPGNAFSSVHYNGHWYWVSNDDFSSKRALTFLLLFFSLAETGAVPQAPVLTLGVGF